MLRIGSFVWGTRDIARSREFWSAALNYVDREEPSDDWVVLVPREGDGAHLALMEVSSEHPKRHHLDLFADDQAAEVERLKSLGATDVEWDYEDDADYIVLADPDGSTFCVVQATGQA